MFYLSNRTHFLWVYRRNKPTRDVVGTREKLVAGFSCNAHRHNYMSDVNVRLAKRAGNSTAVLGRDKLSLAQDRTGRISPSTLLVPYPYSFHIVFGI